MTCETALDREVFEQEYEKTVRDEIERFRLKAEAFVAGQVTEDEFRGFRLRHGIYGQRQPGVQMVRVKIPGGMVTAAQMEALAAIADEFGGGKAHVSTRQNIQYHFVPLARVPEMMHRLADARLTTREACFNTVRNVTVCPLAGLARNEAFDVRPYARQVAFAFLRNPLTDSLPRKFKIAFEGCPDDCIRTDINDIGLRAVVREEGGSLRRGFRMVVGGGLGPLPNEARLLDEFVPEERLISRCEAVIRVFNAHGNRKNKNKARMKFVLLERGFEWFKDAVEREYAQILERGGAAAPELIPEGFGGYESRPAPSPRNPLRVFGAPDEEYRRWLESNVAEQKHPGYATVTVRLEQGNFTSAQMRSLASVAAQYGDGRLRNTIEQNQVLAFVPASQLKQAYAALRQAGLAGAGAREIADVVTCPGAYSCNLGLTKSMNLGAALQEVVETYTDPAVRKLAIKISGCPNSCAQHWIADIGFYGNARKIDGREVPYYQMLLGGGYDRDGMLRFGLAVQSVAARLAPEAVRRVLEHYVANRGGSESFRDYVLRTKIEVFREMTNDLAKPAELFAGMYQDWGDDVDFSLKLGRGECAA